MDDKGKKSKVFVVSIGVSVLLLIIIGFILTWYIVQAGRDNSEVIDTNPTINLQHTSSYQA